MARLIAPNGSQVSVSDERAKVLVEQQGYKPADEKPKSTAKKSSSKKSE